MAEGNLNDHNAEAHRRMKEIGKVIAEFQLCAAGGFSKETIRQNVEYMREIVELKKVEAVAHIDEELFQLRDELVRKVDFACNCKQDILSEIDWKVQRSRQPAECLKSLNSDYLWSLLTLEVRRVEGFRCESFAYIRACSTIPQRIHFMENYDMHKYHVGSNVKMYYLTSMGYDPELIYYTKASAYHEAGEEEVSNADLLNGVYLLEFVAGREGTYDVHVTLFGQHINGSPLKISVQGAVAHKGPHKLESAHTKRQDLSTVAGVTAAAVVMNIGSASVSNASGQEKLEPVVSKEFQMPVDAPKVFDQHINGSPLKISVQGAVAHKGPHKLESAHTERQDLSTVAGVTAAAAVMNIGSASVSNASGQEKLEPVVSKEFQMPVDAPEMFDQHINGSPLKISVQGAVAHKGPHKLESAHTERQDLSTVAGVTAAAVVMNIGSASVSNANGQEKLEPVVSKEFQMPVDAPKGHCKELVTTHANDLLNEIQQPFVQSLLLSGIEPSLSDPSGKSSESPPSDVLSKFFSHIEFPRRQTTVTKHDTLSSQKSALSGLLLGSTGYSSLRSSEPLRSVNVAKSNTSFTGSSQPVSKPGTAAPLTGELERSSCKSARIGMPSCKEVRAAALLSSADGGKTMGDPLKPTYVVTTVALDSSTKLSTASTKMSLTSTHKKETVGFSGTITAKLTLEFDAYRNSKFAFPIGVTATSSGNIIIADTSQDRVVAFDPEGRPLHKATFSGSSDSFRRPSAVVALKDESYAVKDDRCIHIFSKNGEFIRTLGKSNLNKPYGLAAQGENLFTISLGDTVPTLRCFSASGNFEQCMVYGPLVPSPLAGSKCRFMDVHNGHIFVSDLGLSCIYKTDMKGALVSTFGVKGKGCGQMIEPSGVSATDRCVFIGDSKNNRVQAFDANGNFITVVKMASGIVRPSGVHVSAKDKLYVLNYLHGVVGVYNLSFNEFTT